MANRFPDYDVLSKRGSPSWNAQTRAAVDRRLALAGRPDLLSGQQLATLRAVAARVVPQFEGRPSINTVAILLDSIAGGESRDGFRHADLPPALEAWRRGLDAIDGEALARFDAPFAELAPERADALLESLSRGGACFAAWGDMAPDLFWSWRLLPDLVSAHWAHPSAWSAMGFGGPAGPRGYVRLAAYRRDPWEAEERDDG